MQNIENMVIYAKDDTNIADESWWILSVLFTLMTKVTLETPVLAINWKRRLAGLKDLTHVYLLSPLDQEAFSPTG